ncbi:MAG: PKD domain-containing protein, partial [Thermoplasmata archaeon]|nr:PKD domain-containing protein [Thermoplasmata archaeon]
KLEHFLITLETNWINGREVIYLINSTDVEISGNYGYIGIINCQNVTINGEEIDSNGEGLLIVYSKEVYIENCTLNENVHGIYMLHSNFVELLNISLINNEYGFSAKSSKNITAINVSAKQNQKGVNIFSLEKSKAFIDMKNCTFMDNLLSINIENVENVSIENIEADSSIRVYNAVVSLEKGIINDDLQANKASLILNNISIMTINATSSDIWIMKLIFNNSYTAIKVDMSNLSIKNSIFSYNNFAIYAKSSTIVIDESAFERNNQSLFENCEIHVKNSTFTKNNKALEAKNSFGGVLHSVFSNNSYSLIINASLQIMNVTVHGNDYGILLMDDSIVSNITCYNNTVGLQILGNYNQIQKSLFHHNSKGVIINGSGNKVVDCSFWRDLYGIIAYGSNNTVYHNNFINNAENARDYGNNTWYADYPTGGNYWDDYAGNDLYSGESQNESGSDGIGDIPYEFYGNIDKYPLMDFWNQSAQPPNKPPVAFFKFYPQSPFSKENVVFIEMCYDENGKLDIINYTWDFGDGSISYAKNPVHKYSKPGKYNVTLTIKDKAGNNDSITLQISIRNTLPVANFTWEPLQPASQTNIEFNASSSYDLDGSIANYTWDFGDGSIGYGKFVSHKYAKSGEYIVKLTVRDDYGNESYIEKTIKIANRGPVANFVYSPAEPRAGEEINFTDLSVDLDGSIVQWLWDFGDGSISYDKNPVHKYSKPGKYNVTLTVKDDEGGKANYSLTIEVGAKETPAFGIYAIILAIAMVAIWRKRTMKNFK